MLASPMRSLFDVRSVAQHRVPAVNMSLWTRRRCLVSYKLNEPCARHHMEAHIEDDQHNQVFHDEPMSMMI